jgi:hypothetical protein
MIRIHRGDAPEGFEDRSDEWRRRFVEYRKSDAEISASKAWGKLRGEIKADAEVLAERFHHKCAYCEAKPGHVSHPHIEHYRPKGSARFEGRMFDWDNWLLSCGICNQEKWRHFPEDGGKPLLLNPAGEDPAAHVYFVGPRIRGLTKRGTKTIEIVDLDRPDLRSDRGSWLVLVYAILLLWMESSKEEVRQQCREHLIWAMQEDAPYSAMTKALLVDKCPNFARPLSPHPHVDGDKREEQMLSMIKATGPKLASLI